MEAVCIQKFLELNWSEEMINLIFKFFFFYFVCISVFGWLCRLHGIVGPSGVVELT